MKIEKLTKNEISWILYDVANSGFVLIIVTSIMPLFFKSISDPVLDKSSSTSLWAFVNTVSAVIIALLSPVLGAYSDYKNNKKKLFTIFLIIGLTFTFSFIFISEGFWLLCIILFMLANIGWTGTNIFYDSLLVDVTTSKKRDWISSLGYAFGYIGSAVPFIISIAIIFIGMRSSAEGTLPLTAIKISFIIVFFWWFIFSLPLITNVKQKYYLTSQDHPVKDSFSRLLKTLKEISMHKKAFLFLISYFFFIDGVDTIIRMAAVYGSDIGLGFSNLILVILSIQIIAFPFSILFGGLARKYSAKKMILAGLTVYILITIIAFFIPSLPDHNTKVIVFWIVAILVATSQGGVQSLSRSLFSRLIPKENSGEFFGFYNIFGKFSVIIGPLLMGASTMIFNDSKYGVLSILILFIPGIIILMNIKE